MADEMQQQMSFQVTLYQMILSGWVQQSISVAAKLGIPDLLKEFPKSHEQLAIETNTHAPTLYRLLRALSSVGIFNELNDKCFENGSLGVYLQSDVEGSSRGMAIMIGEEWHRDAWSNLLYTVQTGKTAFQKVHGMGFFDYTSKNQEAGEIFNNAMSSFSYASGPIFDYYDFSSFNTIIDIGGGHGSFMEAILNNYPDVKGAIFDLPTVIEGTKPFIQSVGLDSRCECIAGDFFDSVPSGGDAYVMQRIIHDWSDEEAIAILRNCRGAIRENGRIVLLEAVVEPGNDPNPIKFIDLQMIVQLTGKERTEDEYRSLFEQAGFNLSKIVPTSVNVSIIEGIPF